MRCSFNPQRLRSIHAKKTGKKDGSRREDGFNSAAPAVSSKGKRKEGDSDEDEDEEDESEDQRDDDDEEEEEPGVKREKKTDTCEEEVSKSQPGSSLVVSPPSSLQPDLVLQDNSAQSATLEELEKLIEKTHKVNMIPS